MICSDRSRRASDGDSSSLFIAAVYCSLLDDISGLDPMQSYV